jgi:hypothetical protein
MMVDIMIWIIAVCAVGTLVSIVRIKHLLLGIFNELQNNSNPPRMPDYLKYYWDGTPKEEGDFDDPPTSDSERAYQESKKGGEWTDCKKGKVFEVEHAKLQRKKIKGDGLSN